MPGLPLRTHRSNPTSMESSTSRFAGLRRRSRLALYNPPGPTDSSQLRPAQCTSLWLVAFSRDRCRLEAHATVMTSGSGASFTRALKSYCTSSLNLRSTNRWLFALQDRLYHWPGQPLAAHHLSVCCAPAWMSRASISRMARTPTTPKISPFSAPRPRIFTSRSPSSADLQGPKIRTGPLAGARLFFCAPARNL